jgi:hypothetical protein
MTLPAPAEVVPVGSQLTPVSLGDKPYTSPYFSVGREICQNLYVERAQSEFSKAGYFYIKIPGLRRFGPLTTSNVGACRGMLTTSVGSGRRTFTVHGSGVYELLADGSKLILGSINTTTGLVSMADNGTLMMLVDGQAGWILRYADGNLTKITDEYFPGNDAMLGQVAPTFVTYLDTYFIVNVPNTNQYYWSNGFYTWDDVDATPHEYDPLVANGYWSPLRSGQKIGKPDNISALANCNSYLWLFGYNSCEIHYNSGNYNGQQFQRYQGAILNIGCMAPRSVAVYQNNVYFLGTDKDGTLGVFSNDGMNPARISVRGIEQMIQSMRVYTDCIAYCYAQNGHSFYVMQFPTGNKTFVYDSASQAWHERTKLIQGTGDYIRHDAQFATQNFDKIIVGDASTSEVYEFDPFYYQNDNPLDAGVNYIRCVKNTPIGFNLGRNIRYDMVQVLANSGSGTSVNTAAGVGQDPTVQIAWSNDTGVVYSNERPAPLGRQGEYGKRSIVLACGMGRNRVWRIAFTDPTPFILVGLLVRGSPCKF